MGSSTQDRKGRVLGWGTFWGRHLDRSALSPLLAAAVVLITLVISAGVGLSVVWETVARAGTSIPQVLLEWTCAWIALLMALFAWGRVRTGGFPEALILAPVMPVVAVFDAFNALVGSGFFPRFDLAPELTHGTWAASRYWMALGFVL